MQNVEEEQQQEQQRFELYQQQLEQQMRQQLDQQRLEQRQLDLEQQELEQQQLGQQHLNQQDLQLQPRVNGDEAIRVRAALFLRLHAQRAELLAAARHIAPTIAGLRVEMCDWMHRNRVDILNFQQPLHGEVRCMERKVKKQGNFDDLLTLIASEYGDAACKNLVQKLNVLVEQRVQVKRDLRVSFKRGDEFARERHRAVLDEWMPNSQ